MPSKRHCCCFSCDSCATPFINAAGTRTRYPRTAILQIGTYSLSQQTPGDGHDAPDCGQCDPISGNIVLKLQAGSPGSMTWRPGVIGSQNYYFGASGSCSLSYDESLDWPVSTYDSLAAECGCTTFPSSGTGYFLTASIVPFTTTMRLQSGLPRVEAIDPHLDVTGAVANYSVPCGTTKGIVLADTYNIPPGGSASIVVGGTFGDACGVVCTRSNVDIVVLFQDWIELPLAAP